MSPPGIRNGKLADCPSSPNCVCSDASDADHQIPPFRLATGNTAIKEAWASILDLLATTPRVQVTTATDTYLHAEFRSRLLGFVDDVEMHLRPDEGIVAVRSASRTGYSDLGVNRRRIEELRAQLASRRVVHPAAS